VVEEFLGTKWPVKCGPCNAGKILKVAKMK
jgi:hypothetical protein